MSKQAYRGYLIEVASCEREGLFGYRTTIIASDSGRIRYKDSASQSANFQSELAAEDHAFQSARAWAELHPFQRTLQY